MSDAQRITLGQIAPAPTLPRARTIWRYGSSGLNSESGRMVVQEYGPVIRFN